MGRFAFASTLLLLAFNFRGIPGAPVDFSNISSDPNALAIESEAGTIEVDSRCSADMFYWYFPPINETLKNSPSTPVILWLAGGPGGSGLISAFYEVGPLELVGTSKLVRRNITWAETYHMIFVDSPVGTGYSYSRSYSCYAHDTEHDVTRQLNTFLTKFYDEVKPNLKGHPLFIVGESYAGHYVPAIGHYLFRNPIENVPLAGLAIGNGLTYPAYQVAVKADVAYYFGLIGEDKLVEARGWARRSQRLALNYDWEGSLEAREKLEDLIHQESGGVSLYDIRKMGSSSRELEHFANRPQVREAFNVPERKFKNEYDVVDRMKKDIMRPLAKFIPPLLNASVPVLLWEGQMDVKDGFVGTEEWLKHIEWDGKAEYDNSTRKIWMGPWRPNEARVVYGYSREGGSLTHFFDKVSFLSENGTTVVTRNAGHSVPIGQPQVAKQLIDDFISKSVKDRMQ
ncbi:hypothetical protein FOL47_001671 [Perkinsus chesapeaki]|uniref:Carboxypeptidase n=1 Tax=Perkinsus chesapeaki TaxID=330153 RepID=A0A7J6MIC3_PERCH|nr:hypothetical protein FOL47_001671 [Perkinsus chesapeaki]